MSSINNYENLPINLLIKKLNVESGTQIVYADLKSELLSQHDGIPKYNISIKEDDELAIIYYNNSVNNTLDNPINSTSLKTDIENSCKSLVIEKKTLKLIVSQFNKILYNDLGIEFIKNKPMSQIVVNKCYEGTLINIFFHNDKWYTTTRRCLDAADSAWINNKSYYEMFLEAMSGKFVFDELNKEYCYHFILVHNKNKNIVSYDWMGTEYTELFHILTTEKYTLREINEKINDKVRYIEEEHFENIDDILLKLKKLDADDCANNLITSEGYVLRYYHNKIHDGPFTILKLQTDIYVELMESKPNNSNIHQCYLELYQKNKLSKFIPFFTQFGSNVIKRIHASMQNMSKEMLDLYHLTRSKKNPEVYNNLTATYKKYLYQLHGIYINNKKSNCNENNALPQQSDNTLKSINVFDVYNHLKESPPSELRRLYFDRLKIINDENNKFINRRCIDTLTLSTLMNKNK